MLYHPSNNNIAPNTTGKQGFCPRRKRALVPDASRIETNESSSPGSSGQDVARGPESISPGSGGTFSLGSSDEPGLKVCRQTRGPLVPVGGSNRD